MNPGGSSNAYSLGIAHHVLFTETGIRCVCFQYYRNIIQHAQCQLVLYLMISDQDVIDWCIENYWSLKTIQYKLHYTAGI